MLNIIHLYTLNRIYCKEQKLLQRYLKASVGNFIADSNTSIRIHQDPRFSLPEKIDTNIIPKVQKDPCNSKYEL